MKLATAVILRIQSWTSVIVLVLHHLQRDMLNNDMHEYNPTKQHCESFTHFTTNSVRPNNFLIFRVITALVFYFSMTILPCSQGHHVHLSENQRSQENCKMPLRTFLRCHQENSAPPHHHSLLSPEHHLSSHCLRTGMKWREKKSKHFN